MPIDEFAFCPAASTGALVEFETIGANSEHGCCVIGFPVDVPQLFRSEQALAWILELQEVHSEHFQFGLHADDVAVLVEVVVEVVVLCVVETVNVRASEDGR